MRIGMCGAHRTGKTTLAALLAERLGLDFIATKTTDIVKAHGFDLANDHRISLEGLAMQCEIAKGLENAVDGRDDFVADRTPIDAAAYLLADATANRGDERIWELVMGFHDEAIRQTFRRFDLIVLVPPAIPFVAQDDKPPMNTAYQMHHHLLCRAMLLDRDYVQPAVEIPTEVTCLEERLIFVQAHLDEAACARKIRAALTTKAA